MPFKFKLSRRLARLKAVVSTAAIVALAHCSDAVVDPTAQDVTTPPATMAEVELTPDTLTIEVGDSRQFAAYGRLSNGDSVTVNVAFSATGGVVTGDGTYTAGATPGTYEVTAAADAGAFADTSAVTVVPAPPVGSQVDTIFVDGFESGDLSNWDDNFFAANKTVQNDPGSAHSGSHYLRIFYPQGSNGGALSRFFMPGYDSAYVRYYLRFPTTWQGGTKLLSLRTSRTDDRWSSLGIAGDCPDGTDFTAAYVIARPPSSLPLRFYTYYPGMGGAPDGPCWGSYGEGTHPTSASYFEPLDVSKGVWHEIELEVVLNTPGKANGVQRFWLDGVLRGEWYGMTFRTSDILMINVVQGRAHVKN
jgi:hypothetical protein